MPFRESLRSLGGSLVGLHLDELSDIAAPIEPLPARDNIGQRLGTSRGAPRADRARPDEAVELLLGDLIGVKQVVIAVGCACARVGIWWRVFVHDCNGHRW